MAGAYVDASWSAADWLVAGGLRLDRWENTGGFRQENTLATGAILLNESDPDRSGEVVSARLAVRRDLGGGYAARAAAYSGFRPATLNELHRPFRVGNDITEANAALTPETMKGVETGLAFDRDGIRWGTSVFWNQIRGRHRQCDDRRRAGNLPPRRVRAGGRGAAAAPERGNDRRLGGGADGGAGPVVGRVAERRCVLDRRRDRWRIVRRAADWPASRPGAGMERDRRAGLARDRSTDPGAGGAL